MQKPLFLAMLFFSLLFINVSGQKLALDSARYNKKYWSIETAPVWAIYPGIYKINFVRQLWEKKTFKGELGFSLNIQPPRTDTISGSFSSEWISLFYRQYFWKGFYVQLETNLAYGRLLGYPTTGGNYESYAVFHDFIGGYRFIILKRQKVALTISPQAGGGFTSYVNKTWPRIELPFWEVNLLVGLHF